MDQQPTTTRHPKPQGTRVRIPPCALIEEVKRTGPRQCLIRTATAPRKDPPVIGVRIQRFSATKARKLAALLAAPPSRPGIHRPPPALPASQKTATPARPTSPAAVPTTPPVDATKPEQPKQRLTHGQGKASLMEIFGDTLSDLEDENSATPAEPTRAKMTTVTRRPAPTETSAAPRGATTSLTEEAPYQTERPAWTPTPAPPRNVLPTATNGHATANHRALPSVPVRVRDDLIIHVPYHAARVSRVYKVRLATPVYTAL